MAGNGNRRNCSPGLLLRRPQSRVSPFLAACFSALSQQAKSWPQARSGAAVERK